MTNEEFINNIRDEVREEGFVNAIKLLVIINKRADQFGIIDKINSIDIMREIPCADILTVKYSNATAKNYRRKDLYYFLPQK